MTDPWQVAGYTHLRELGAGASGRVVLAVHDNTGVPVAIKYLSSELADDPQFRTDFRAEAQVLVEVQDPHVARLHEYVEGPGGCAIVMELVDGASLRQVLGEGGPTEPESALYVLKGSLLGLAAAHARGVVHRDYKPENVLVDAEGASKLADFGIAVRAGARADISGTPGYMAPEQWNGQPATPATDIYAATATFYECVTGRPPYDGGGDLTVLKRQHENGRIPVENAPRTLHGLIRDGLAKRPTDRPRSAWDFVQVLDGVAVAAYGPDWEERGRRRLAERVAALALLFPLANQTGGGTAVATTALGTGGRPGFGRRALLAGSAAVVLLLGGGVGYGYVRDQPVSAGSGTPRPSTSSVVTPSDEPSSGVSVEPTPSATPTAGPTGSPSAGRPPTRTSSPPRITPSTQPPPPVTTTSPPPPVTTTSPPPPVTTSPPPPPDEIGPVVNRVASPGTIAQVYNNSTCTSGYATTAAVIAYVSDKTDPASNLVVWFTYALPGGKTGSVSMHQEQSYFTGTLGPFSYGSVPEAGGSIPITVHAKDKAGNLATPVQTKASLLSCYIIR
jgi:serine/threonine protein kinase